jgi:hypothetical protein
MPVWIINKPNRLERAPCLVKCARIQRAHTLEPVHRHIEYVIPHRVGGLPSLCRQLPQSCDNRRRHIKGPLAKERRGQGAHVAKPFAESAPPVKGHRHVRGRETMGRYYWRADGGLDRQFPPVALGAFRQLSEGRERPGKVRDGFQVGGTLYRTPSGFEPIVAGAIRLLRYGVMARQHLRLARCSVRKACFQSRGDPRVKCSSNVQMSVLSNLEMSVSAAIWRSVEDDVGDGAERERWGAATARGVAGRRSWWAAGKGSSAASGAQRSPGVAIIEGVPE